MELTNEENIISLCNLNQLYNSSGCELAKRGVVLVGTCKTEVGCVCTCTFVFGFGVIYSSCYDCMEIGEEDAVQKEN